jgi:hypothetical protein
MNVKVTVKDPVGRIIRIDVIPLLANWTLNYRQSGMIGGTIVGEIVLEVVPGSVTTDD